MSILGNIIAKISVLPQRKHKLSVDDLIKIEAKIGAQVFGPVPEGRSREFFCVTARTWVWKESYIDDTTGRMQTLITKYEINDDGIKKIQDGQLPKYTSLDESRNLLKAVKGYYRLVSSQIYERQLV